MIRWHNTDSTISFAHPNLSHLVRMACQCPPHVRLRLIWTPDVRVGVAPRLACQGSDVLVSTTGGSWARRESWS